MKIYFIIIILLKWIDNLLKIISNLLKNTKDRKMWMKTINSNSTYDIKIYKPLTKSITKLISERQNNLQKKYVFTII